MSTTRKGFSDKLFKTPNCSLFSFHIVTCCISLYLIVTFFYTNMNLLMLLLLLDSSSINNLNDDKDEHWLTDDSRHDALDEVSILTPINRADRNCFLQFHVAIRLLYLSLLLRAADSLKFSTNPISVVEMHAVSACEQFNFNIYLGHIKIGNKEENDFFFSGIFINS